MKNINETAEQPIKTARELEIPIDYKSKIILSDGALYIDDGLKGSQDVFAFISVAKRQYGINTVYWKDKKELVEIFDVKKMEDSFATNFPDTDSYIQKYIADLFVKAKNTTATDIHITWTGHKTILEFRCMGLMSLFEETSGDLGIRVINAICNTQSKSSTSSTFSESKSFDGKILSANKIQLPAGVHAIRIHTNPIDAVDAPNGTGTMMVLRLLYDSTKTSGFTVAERLQTLGYSNQHIAALEFLTNRKGITIISGNTGSGKSTALKHIMEGMVNEKPERKYISVEDPPEYPMKNVSQVKVVAGNELGKDSDYARALADALRSDLDVLMVGEIRFGEAASATIQAALTGHSVFATLHAIDAINIISRLEGLLRNNTFADLSTIYNPEVLAGLICQQLIPKLCENCKTKYTDWLNMEDKKAKEFILPKKDLENLLSVPDVNIDFEQLYVRNYKGCPECDYSGFKGQTIVAEVIVTDYKFFSLIKERKHDEAIKYWKETLHGKSYVDHAIEKVLNGIADPKITKLRLGRPYNFNHAISSV